MTVLRILSKKRNFLFQENLKDKERYKKIKVLRKEKSEQGNPSIPIQPGVRVSERVCYMSTHRGCEGRGWLLRVGCLHSELVGWRYWALRIFFFFPFLLTRSATPPTGLDRPATVAGWLANCAIAVAGPLVSL